MNGDTTPPHMPSELVLEIVAWLPVKSLLRFRCVCKAWRDTISDDAAFHRAHLRAQPPRLLISTCTEEDRMNKVTTIGLYVSEESAALADTIDFPEDHTYYFSHCNGLVLMPWSACSTLPHGAYFHCLGAPTVYH
ncbi:F-box protein At1g11270-like [Triticum aestivum]|uniref:F-box protein At1g11270-like n=1 Tax=Triticum aestivum TaxID=4565 RepID=UPI001D02696E|nr:F-box protein At1g11270-like [Triticum aestivum]